MNEFIMVLRRKLHQALVTLQLDEAAELLARLKEEEPLSLETRGFELEYRVRCKAGPAAAELAEQLLRSFAGSARIQFWAGRAHYQQRDYPQAVACFLESERLYPHWRTQRWQGKSYTQMGAFTKAEPLLLGLLERHDVVAPDLAWMYERMERFEQAIDYLKPYLERHPQDSFVRAQWERLQSRALDAEELVEEVETLQALDERPSGAMLATYVERLLETGQGERVRELMAKEAPGMDMHTAASVGWACHRLQAYDLALQLFLKALPENLNYYKYLGALEDSARHCHRIPELIEAYRIHAPEQKGLYGRIKKLEK
jgi:tetratricopeptide (TPR) repeat protein